MAPPTVSLRCPRCGTELRVVLAPSPPTQWFPCPHCAAPVPVVVPRDPPPLYTWEVLPGLYPALPPPRPRRKGWRSVGAIALAVIATLAFSSTVVLALVDEQATAPGAYTVSGTVYREVAGGGHVPAAGALVLLRTEGGAARSCPLNANAGFSCFGVPSGGFTLNISLAGYAPHEIDSLVTPVWDAGSSGLVITLVPGTVANGTREILSPFPDLESFLATLGGAAGLLGLVGAVAGSACFVTVRTERPALGVVGGAAGAIAPFTLYLLGVVPAAPVALALAAVAGAFGGFATAFFASEVGLVPGSGNAS